MAVFPEGSPGVFPIDPTSDVGKFRALYGDVFSTPYTPVEPGYQSYTELSDAEIEAFISQAGNSIPRAIGFYYMSMAGSAAKVSKSWKDYDLASDTTKRPAELRAIAQWWFDLADDEDSIAGEEAFEIVPTGTRSGGFIPEGTNPIWGRKYTMGRWR